MEEDRNANGYYDKKICTQEQVDNLKEQYKEEIGKIKDDNKDLENHLWTLSNYIKNNDIGQAMEYLKGIGR